MKHKTFLQRPLPTPFPSEVPEEEQTRDEARIDLTLDSSVFFGPIAALQVSTVGELLGARAKLKVGPKFEGKLNMGMLRESRQYNLTFYSNAKLKACNRIALEGAVINRHNLVWGEVDEHKVAEAFLEINASTTDLFPWLISPPSSIR